MGTFWKYKFENFDFPLLQCKTRFSRCCCRCRVRCDQWCWCHLFHSNPHKKPSPLIAEDRYDISIEVDTKDTDPLPADYTFKPKIHSDIPNFSRLHQQVEDELAVRKSYNAATKPEPFQLRTVRLAGKCNPEEVRKENLRFPPRTPTFSHSFLPSFFLSFFLPFFFFSFPPFLRAFSFSPT